MKKEMVGWSFDGWALIIQHRRHWRSVIYACSMLCNVVHIFGSDMASRYIVLLASMILKDSWRMLEASTNSNFTLKKIIAIFLRKMNDSENMMVENQILGTD